MDSTQPNPPSTPTAPSNRSSPPKPSRTTRTRATHGPDGSGRQSKPSPPVTAATVPPPTLTTTTPATARLLAAFGLGGRAERRTIVELQPDLIDPLAHALVHVTGPSGSGKTTALPLILEALGVDPPDPLPAPSPTAAIIDDVGLPPAAAASLLASVGVTDPMSWASPASALSQGQADRYAIARELAIPNRPVIADDWLCRVDRPAALAAAYTLGRRLRESGRVAVIIRPDADLADELAPHLHLAVGWDRSLTPVPVKAAPAFPSVLSDVEVTEGTHADWRALKHLHYASGDPATAAEIYTARLANDPAPAAVAILSFPDLHSGARNLATADAYKIAGARANAQRLNREVRRLSRIVVRPEFRGCGLARMLVAEAAARTPAKWLECTTALGPYTQFLARSGFTHVPQHQSTAEAALMDWIDQGHIDPRALADPDAFAAACDALSVRKRREARRLIWRHFHHYVLYRRTRKRAPKQVPAPSDRAWAEAFSVASKRAVAKPEYWVLGPLR